MNFEPIWASLHHRCACLKSWKVLYSRGSVTARNLTLSHWLDWKNSVSLNGHFRWPRSRSPFMAEIYWDHGAKVGPSIRAAKSCDTLPPKSGRILSGWHLVVQVLNRRTRWYSRLWLSSRGMRSQRLVNHFWDSSVQRWGLQTKLKRLHKKSFKGQLHCSIWHSLS